MPDVITPGITFIYKTDDMLTVFQTETIDAAELIVEFKRFMLAINYPPGKLG